MRSCLPPCDEHLGLASGCFGGQSGSKWKYTQLGAFLISELPDYFEFGCNRKAVYVEMLVTSPFIPLPFIIGSSRCLSLEWLLKCPCLVAEVYDPVIKIHSHKDSVAAWEVFMA